MAHKSKTTPSSILQSFRIEDAEQNPVQLKYDLNITETAHKYKFEIVAPGFKKGDFKIVTDGSLLTISAEADNEKHPGKENYIRREFLKPSLSRDFIMPEDVISDHVSSGYHNGMLTISIKKNHKYLAGEKEVKVD
jgi:HSP20 family protein